MKCKICGKRFELRKENRYDAIDIPVGLDCLTQPSIYYNAFDCPYCGCQNIVGKIKANRIPKKKGG